MRLTPKASESIKQFTTVSQTSTISRKQAVREHTVQIKLETVITVASHENMKYSYTSTVK